MSVRLLDTTPRWLRLTLGCSSAVLVVTGILFFFGQLTQFDISPFTLLLHLALALAVSSWILNLRLRISPDWTPLVVVGVSVVVGCISGSAWLRSGSFRAGSVTGRELVGGDRLV